MKAYSVTHPSGPHFELDWYDDNNPPTQDQLDHILGTHTGLSSPSHNDLGDNSTNSPTQDNPQAWQDPSLQDAQSNRRGVRLAIGSDTQPAGALLTSGRQQGSTLAPYAQSILDRFDNAAMDPKDKSLPSEMKKFRPKLIQILQKYGTPDQISQSPPNIRATLYALTQLGNQSYGSAGTVSDPQIGEIKNNRYKCNIFASKCWARGAGIGYNVNGSNPNGYPTYPGSNLPTSANDIYTNAYNMRNFTHTTMPKEGDIFAYHHPNEGHSGIYLGGDLSIYAGPNDVKLGTLSYVRQSVQFDTPPRFRTFTPGH